MNLVTEAITHIILFIALYLEIFFLITYFEIREKDKKSISNILNYKNKNKLPTVSIMVPVWNEEMTVTKTIFSLLKLDYPKDKLNLLIIDDGSTDNTFNVLQKFRNNKQIQIFRKENGGKHTALNYGLNFVKTDLVGCLDADSFVHKDALKRIVLAFRDSKIMAVTPSVKVFEPKGILGLIQKSEYMFGIFLRKIFSQLNALYITPGPFSIFRRSVFEKIGGYRHAHNTEDMEIAMRMQKNKMKIGNVHNAFVYTVTPKTLYTLYKQRLRWVYGFLRNAVDYRDMFFKPEYGNLGIVVLPAASFSVFSTMYFFGSNVISWIKFLISKIEEILEIGLSFKSFNFDLFYLNTDTIVFVAIVAILGTIFIIITSRSLAEERGKFGFDSILFLLLYSTIAPIWMSRAIFNLIFSRTTKWR